MSFHPPLHSAQTPSPQRDASDFDSSGRLIGLHSPTERPTRGESAAAIVCDMQLANGGELRRFSEADFLRAADRLWKTHCWQLKAHSQRLASFRLFLQTWDGDDGLRVREVSPGRYDVQGTYKRGKKKMAVASLPNVPATAAAANAVQGTYRRPLARARGRKEMAAASLPNVPATAAAADAAVAGPSGDWVANYAEDGRLLSARGGRPTWGDAIAAIYCRLKEKGGGRTRFSPEEFRCKAVELWDEVCWPFARGKSWENNMNYMMKNWDGRLASGLVVKVEKSGVWTLGRDAPSPQISTGKRQPGSGLDKTSLKKRRKSSAPRRSQPPVASTSGGISPALDASPDVIGISDCDEPNKSTDSDAVAVAPGRGQADACSDDGFVRERLALHLRDLQPAASDPESLIAMDTEELCRVVSGAMIDFKEGLRPQFPILVPCLKKLFGSLGISGDAIVEFPSSELLQMIMEGLKNDAEYCLEGGTTRLHEWRLQRFLQSLRP